MININIPTDGKRSMISAYLEILNIVNPNPTSKLTEGEIRILIEFLLLPEKYSFQRFSRYAKPEVLENLKKYYTWDLTKLNLNSKIYELIDKGYIWRDTDGVLYIKEYLINSIKNLEDRKIMINFNVNSKD